MTEKADLPASSDARRPRQNRGEQRIKAILDACERLIVGKGEAALTMHGLARESRASIGSLYHFFRDKQGVLGALSDRHQAAVELIAERADAIPDETWRQADASALVALLVQPFLDYVAQNPVILHLMRVDRSAGRSPTDTPVHPLLQRVCQRILALRLPAASERQRQAYTATLLGLPLGIITDLMVDYDEVLREAVLHHEIPRALVAYVDAVERAC